MADWLSPSEIAAHRPDYSAEEARRLLADRYELEGTVVSLPSDRDRNFRISTPYGQSYVLRIVSTAVPADRVAFEIEVLARMEGRLGGVDVPVVVPTLDRPTLFTTERAESAYLVHWLEGKHLGDARPHTRELLRQVGRTVALVDGALSTLDGLGLVASPWDLLRSHEVVVELMGAVNDDQRKRILIHFLDHFREAALPHLESLPRQVVHNDLNDYNLLVAIEPKGLRLSGLLDVGDAHRSARVADPAIAAAYAALHWDDPVGAAAEIAGAYNDTLELTDEELRVFLPLLTMRLCASVCISAYRQGGVADDPYVTVSQAGAWRTLERLHEQPMNLGHYRIRAACGREPCPQSSNIRRWLESRSGSFSSVSGHDLRSEKLLALDLSVSSSARYIQVETAVRDMEADVAIGRYDEVRLAYSNPLYEIATLDGMVQRTVHIGTDVFLPIGDDIRAPLEGEVYGLADNDEPLSYGPTVVLRHDPAGCPAFYTLYGHLHRADLSAWEVGQTVQPGSVIGHVGAPSENGGWTPHLHFQVIADMLGRRSDFPGVCSFQDRATWKSICPEPYVVLGITGPAVFHDEIDRNQLVRDRSRMLGPSLSVSYDSPLLILRGKDTYMFDHAGRRYLDCVNNVNHVGHSHPEVERAVADQMRVLNTNTRYLHPAIVEYAKRLTATLPEPLSVCFFVNSGSEANDLALRLARAHTGHDGLVVVDAAYHGHLTSLIEISPYKFDGPGGEGPGQSTFVAPLPDTYRGRFTDGRASDRYAAVARECLETAQRSEAGLAAFISESLLSCGGQIELPAGYLRHVYHEARERGAVCIADEVQVGFGRVGTHFWGFETQGVVPDIVTMGKPIGNGHPLGAVVTTREIAASFDTGMEYFNTYGGNPVSCAAGLAVLDIVERESLQMRAMDVGRYLIERLRDLQHRSPLIGDVRGRGLFLGVELVSDRATKSPATAQARYVINRARHLGVLLSTDGPDHNVLKIKPPLTFARHDADTLVEVLGQILDEDPVKV